ncbi:MAG: hypothetical protein WEA58_04055 [Balneolaceae bacterium]
MADPAIKSYPSDNLSPGGDLAISERDESAAKVGRPPMDSYLNADEITPPESIDQFATSKARILENYPFFGTLLKSKNGHYRILKTYTKENNTNIEQVEQVHGHGEYQLRFLVRNKEHLIAFSIDEPQKEEQKPTSNTREDAFLKDELYESQQEVKRLKERIKDRDSDLDEQLRKIRKLNQEIIELERTGEKRHKEKIDRIEAERDKLKEKLDELNKENFELKMDLKYADSEGGFDLMSTVKDIVEDESVRGFLTNMMQNKQAGYGATPTPIHQISQARENPGNLSGAPDNQQNKQELALQIMQKFVNVVFKCAAEALTEENPDYKQVAGFVQQQVQSVQSQGLTIDPQNWVNLAKSLVQFAIQNNISSEKLANVVSPLLENVGQAKSALNVMPVNVVISTLDGMYNLNLAAQEKDVLKDILNIFKNRLKG